MMPPVCLLWPVTAGGSVSHAAVGIRLSLEGKGRASQGRQMLREEHRGQKLQLTWPDSGCPDTKVWDNILSKESI